MRIRLFPLLVLLPACAATSWRYEGSANAAFQRGDLLAYADANLAPSTQPVALLPLDATEFESLHLALVREEPLHRHERHDLVVVGLRGEGTLWLRDTGGERPVPVRSGTVVAIPRGTGHAFRAVGSGPCVALAIFAPPYDGKDAVLIRPE